MRLGFKLFAFNVQIDFLVAKLERLTCHGRRATYERFKRHAQHARIKVDADTLVASGKYEVIEMVNHDEI